MSRRLIAVLVAALALAACRQEMVYEVRDRPVPQASQAILTDEQMEKLVAHAAMVKNWKVETIKPGHLRATLDLRLKHVAVSDIYFNRRSYSIVLNSSVNLRQDDSGHIHRNYNRAVRALEDEIDRALYRAAY